MLRESQRLQPVFPASTGDGQRTAANRPISHGPGVSDEIHPRLLAVIVAARFYGMELDPGDFPRMPGEHMPSAAALAVWLRNVGMWHERYGCGGAS
jgi:subfamily B ATP-binding cassette protein HlyB/CyaB